MPNDVWDAIEKAQQEHGTTTELKEMISGEGDLPRCALCQQRGRDFNISRQAVLRHQKALMFCNECQENRKDECDALQAQVPLREPVVT
jgi:hypothetical protein